MTDAPEADHDQAVKNYRAYKDYVLHQRFSARVMAVWSEMLQEAGVENQPHFQKITKNSLLHTAAVLSVDLNEHMAEFAGLAAAYHQTLHNRATKFG